MFQENWLQRVDFAPLFRIKLCFPAFLLDKVSPTHTLQRPQEKEKTSKGIGIFLNSRIPISQYLSGDIHPKKEHFLEKEYYENPQHFRDSAVSGGQR